MNEISLSTRYFRRVVGLFMPRVAAVVLLSLFVLGAEIAVAQETIGADALRQIQSLLLEKESRTPQQRKVHSNLLYESKRRRGERITAEVAALDTGIGVSSDGTVVVDISAVVGRSLLARILELGGQVIDSRPESNSIRAAVPIEMLETLAADPAVRFIQPKQEGATSASAAPSLGRRSFQGLGDTANAAGSTGSPAARLPAAGPASVTAINISEGVTTHRADLAQAAYNARGAGVKIGVLSDGVGSLATLQASGDLPAVTVLAGQAGSGTEGSAMLEIVHDMAPDAQLYFATALNGIASFAQNIRNLRAAGCDIIIDDFTYWAETPFQMGQAPAVLSPHNAGLLIQAVNDVTAAGALYFSDAGNSGSKDKGTSGTWQGDFADGGPVGSPIPGLGRLHDFGQGTGITTTYDQVLAASSNGSWTTLTWTDPLGGSANDYDLFRLNSTGTAVLASSTDTQSGTQDPFEYITAPSAGDRLVIVKHSGSDRFLRLDTNRGRLARSTEGATYGHNASPGANAFGVAATPAQPPGPYPGPFNALNTLETFSSDGPRRYFFNGDGSAITPGDFSSTGGQVIQQPALTAADKVSCAAPGFSTFFGTSAAAPHAGAIAALVKSVNPSLTPSQIAGILTTTTIDIEAPGIDRDSGYGIVDAFSAVTAASPTSNYALTVTGGGTGQGIVTGSGMACKIDAGVDSGTCSLGYASGTVVSLTATPTGTSTFTGWGGACSGNGSCTVTMTANQSVSASFGAATPPPGTAIWSENFDGVEAPSIPVDWVATNAVGPLPEWMTSALNADTVPNDVFVDDPGSVSDKRLETPLIAVNSGSAQLTFRSSYDFEPGFDGGVLEIRIGSGEFVDILVAGGSFGAGGYGSTIAGGSGNPLAGRPAWSGNSGGYVTTQVNLPSAAAGQNVQFRFRMGSNDSVAGGGWRVDSLTLTDVPPLNPGFYPVPPCRLVDTRYPVGSMGGPSLVAGTSRSFAVVGHCSIPSTATAVSVNVTVTDPTGGPGFLTVYSGGSPVPLASTINYRLGITRANNAIVPLGAVGDLSVFCGQGGGTAQLVLDVNGYFE